MIIDNNMIEGYHCLSAKCSELSIVLFTYHTLRNVLVHAAHAEKFYLYIQYFSKYMPSGTNLCNHRFNVGSSLLQGKFYQRECRLASIMMADDQPPFNWFRLEGGMEFTTLNYFIYDVTHYGVPKTGVTDVVFKRSISSMPWVFM